MNSTPTQTAREKLEAWLRYYEDLNLGAFYTDRRTMPKRASLRRAVAVQPKAEAPKAAQAAESELLPAVASAPVRIPALPKGLQLTPTQPAFNVLDRIEGDTLARIREDLGDCTRCRLATTRNKIVFGAGNEHAELVFVGEGPGRDEDMQGLPFVGRAGKLLTQMIEAMTLTRDQVYIANVVKCRPPENRKPEEDESATCSPFLYRQIDAIAPKAIVCLGLTAAQSLLKTKDSISKIRGEWLEYRGTKLMVTYHPAYLLRNPPAKADVWKDLQKVMALLGLKVKKGSK
jgi:uracil-DNA glycosylase